MDVIQAAGLGMLQGITEFLPISSSGHLILAHTWIGTVSGGLTFDAVLHFATALSILVYFWRDLFSLARSAFRWMRIKDIHEGEKTLIVALIVATIPAVILGLLLEDIMATMFREPLLVAGALLVGSAIMFFAEKHRYALAASRRHTKVDTEERGMETLHTGQAVLIGLFQSLALVPGMSRSGMAISGGMYMGLSREESAKFAFLLAVPLLLGAGAKKLIEIISLSSGTYQFAPLIIGAFAAFVVGLTVIHYLLKFLREHSLMVFVWYRTLLAALIFVLVLG